MHGVEASRRCAIELLQITEIILMKFMETVRRNNPRGRDTTLRR